MRNALRLLFACMAAAMAVSCASAPKAADSLETARKAAEDSRAKAVGIKADVASKALFGQADAVFNEAKTVEAAPDPKNAAVKYGEATGLFMNAYDDALAKKDAAQKSLDQAAQERKTAEDTFAEAEKEQLAAGKGE